MSRSETHIHQTRARTPDAVRFAVVVDIDEGAGPRAAFRHAEQTLRAVFPAIEAHSDGAVVDLWGDSAADAVRSIRSLGRRARRSIDPSGRVWMGISRMRPEGVAAAIRDAKRAIDLGRLLSSEPQVVLHEDLLVVDLLVRDRELCSRMASVLDPVVSYDKTRSVLLPTLTAFVEADLSSHATARKLRVHRHTVDYRVRRIESLLGRSIKSGRDRILVEMALLASQILGIPHSAGIKRALDG